MSRIGTWTRRFNERLWVWIPGAIALGLLVPGIGHLEGFALLFLALIVGGVAYTLDLRGFRALPVPRLPAWLLAHALMIPVAWGLGHLFSLSPIHVAGLVLLGASTPDLTSPLLTRMSHGDTNASMLLLAAAGLTSLLLIPVGAHLFIDPDLRVPLNDVFTVLLVGILLPALIAMGLRQTVNRIALSGGDAEGAVAISTLATLAITAVVAAVNRTLFLTAPASLDWPALLGAAAALFATGLLLGHLIGITTARSAPALRTAGLFIPGTREYALAAALVLAAGFPAEAAVLPLVFGGIQMVTAPLLARRIARIRRGHAPTG